MERKAPWKLFPAINSLVAGHSDPPWPVRWRYWLFLAVCRLQKRRPVVPPVDFQVKTARAATERAPEVAEHV